MKGRNMWVFVAIIIFYLACNVWLFISLLRSLQGMPAFVKVGVGVVYWLLALSFIVMQAVRNRPLSSGFGHFLYWTSNGWLVFFFYMFLLTLVTTILNRFGLHLPYAFAWSALVAVIALSVGFFRFNHPEVRHITVNSDRPLSSGVRSLRVVAVSDMHLGYGVMRDRLARYVDLINSQHPDLVLIGGDLVDMTTVPLHKQQMQQELNRIDAPMGIYMALGNHEYISGIDESLAFLRSTKIRLLRDSVVTLPCGLQVAGRDDRSNPRRVSATELLAKADPEKPLIVIDHQPQNAQVAEIAGLQPDFAFFGHTHHGQVWPASLATDLIYDLSHGTRREGRATLCTSSGLGIWGPPFRIGTTSELHVVDFRFPEAVPSTR